MTTNQKNADQTASPTDDAGESQVQAKVDREDDRGYRGHHADPTPNHAYTVAGVTSGEPTPETDADAAAEAKSHKADLDKKGGAR